MKVNNLNEDQRGHLAYRLDHNTACGFLTAARVAKGEGDFGEMDLVDVFVWAGSSRRSGQVLAKKVINFKSDPNVKIAWDMSSQIIATFQRLTANNVAVAHLVEDNLFHFFKNLKDLKKE